VSSLANGVAGIRKQFIVDSELWQLINVNLKISVADAKWWDSQGLKDNGKDLLDN
jgi:hypothetical protein